MGSTPRTRLDRDARRAQLVQLGLEMLSTRPLDKVAIDDIATEAGISRGLLFHYFPTKRDYHRAVAEAAARDLLRRTAIDPALPPKTALRRSIEAYVDHVTENRDAYIAFIRGSGGGDSGLGEVSDDARAAFTARVLAGLGAAQASDRMRAAVRGWVGFTEEVTVDWLSRSGLDRDELVALIADALVALVAMAVRDPGTGGLPLLS